MRTLTCFIIPALLSGQATHPDLDARLRDAASRCDLAEVQKLITQGADPKARGAQGETVLHCLAANSDWKDKAKVAEILLAAGADLNAQNEKGCTPLMGSIINNTSARLGIWLLAKGARTDLANDQGETALMMFPGRLGSKDQEALLQAELKAKPDLEQRDHQGRTALLRCIPGSLPNDPYLQSLLEAGADLKARDHEGRTALHLVCQSEWGKERAAWLLSKGADPSATDHLGRTPLFPALEVTWSSHDKKVDLVSLLLKAGVDPNHPDAHGTTPLSSAAAYGNRDAMELLLGAGAKVHARDADGDSPFADAALHQQFGTAHRLIQAGAKVEEAYRGDWPALAKALKAGRAEAWEEVRKGDEAEQAKGKAGVPQGWTWMAFAVAAMKGDAAFFQACRRSGIAIPVPQGAGDHPYQHPLVLMAASFGQTDLLDTFLRDPSIPFPAKPDWGGPLATRVEDETTPEAFSRLLAWETRHREFAAEPADLVEQGIRSGSLPLLALVLERRASGIPWKGGESNHLLQEAAELPDRAALRLLLKAGATATTGEKPGEPTFWDAVMERKATGMDMAELILLNPRNARIGFGYGGPAILRAPQILKDPAAVRRLLDGGIKAEAFLAGADGRPDGTFFALEADSEAIKLILARCGSDLNALDEDGLPPIAKVSSPAALLSLLDKGVRAHWRNKAGQTEYLLHHLLDNAENGAELSLAFLSRPESRPQVQAKDPKGRLPLGIIASLRPTPPWCGTGYDGAAHLARVQAVAGKIIRALLEAGAKPDAVDRAGLTPLELAAGGVAGDYRGGDQAIFCALEGCLSPLSPGLRRKAIEAALRAQNIETLTTLLADTKSLDPQWPWTQWLRDCIDRDFTAALTSALVKTRFVPFPARLEIFWDKANTWDAPRLVPALGLSSLRPADSATAVLDAAQAGDANRLQEALAHAFPDVRSEEGRTPLMEAAQQGSIPCVRILLKAGANANLHDLKRDRPLTVALHSGHDDLARVLLAEGKADPNLRGPNGELPLVRAIKDRNHARIALLLEAGVDPRAEIYQTVGDAPLNAAARSGDLETLKLLVARFHMDPAVDQAAHDPYFKLEPRGTTSMSVNGVGSQMAGFNTPLVAAVKANRLEVADWLLSQGCPVTDSKDNGLLYELVAGGRVDMIRLIGPHMPVTAYSKQLKFEFEHQSPILHAIKENHVDVLHALLDSGFPPNQSCGSGLNGLHESILHGNVEALALLLAKHAIPLEGEGGAFTVVDANSPLVMSVLQNQPECVRLLLQAGANPRPVLKNQPGTNLIHQATQNYYRRQSNRSLRPLIQILLDAGLDINQRNDMDGHTPLDWAQGPGNAELAEVLKRFGAKRGEELGPWKKAER